MSCSVRTSVPRRESGWQWKPTSSQQAAEVEDDMLASMRLIYEQATVAVRGGTLNTVRVGTGPPLVLLHGMGAAIGFWVANIPEYVRHYTVFAIDLPGYGRSTRIPFSGSTTKEAEDYFINAIEEWRIQMELPRFRLMGHSMGGYLAAVYALTYPQRVSHLVLADPWGVPRKEPDAKSSSMRRRVIGGALTKFNPLAAIRATGPWGPELVYKYRQDLAQKFAAVLPDPSIVLDYAYHMNSLDPTGEKAFTTMSIGHQYAKNPLCDRLLKLDPSVRLAFIYGDDSWTEPQTGAAIADALPGRATWQSIHNAGHHVYIDVPATFNSAVLAELQAEDIAPRG